MLKTFWPHHLFIIQMLNTSYICISMRIFGEYDVILPGLVTFGMHLALNLAANVALGYCLPCFHNRYLPLHLVQRPNSVDLAPDADYVRSSAGTQIVHVGLPEWGYSQGAAEHETLINSLCMVTVDVVMGVHKCLNNVINQPLPVGLMFIHWPYFETAVGKDPTHIPH
jgi:hypothetical protein